MSNLMTLIEPLENPRLTTLISFNDHWSCYDTVQDHFDFRDKHPSWFVDFDRMVATQTAWDIYQIDRTGNGALNHRQIASTLALALGSSEPVGGPEWELIGRITEDRPNSLYLTFNEHAPEIYGEMVFDDYRDDQWASEDDHLQALMTNRVWSVQYYPRTPVGFCVGLGPTLLRALQVFF